MVSRSSAADQAGVVDVSGELDGPGGDVDRQAFAVEPARLGDDDGRGDVRVVAGDPASLGELVVGRAGRR